jgi:hypothetical protein
MHIADLLSIGAGALPSRFFGALNQTAIRNEILHGGKAFNSVNLVEENPRENFADTVDRF